MKRLVLAAASSIMLVGTSLLSRAAAVEPVGVASGTGDFNRDGIPDKLELKLVSGSHSIGEEWCGTADKYEGQFVLRVSVAGRDALEEALSPAWFGYRPEDALSFPATPWTIVVRDYNHDGQLDFNLGRYSGCNGWSYRLFTIAPSGKVSVLALPAGELFIEDRAASTQRIQVTQNGFACSAYDNVVGEHYKAWYRWDPKARAFVLSKTRRVSD